MTCGIYMIKKRNNGQKYIGQSINIENRFREHKSLKDKSSHIDNAINKYGVGAFDFLILKELPEDRDLLNKYEKYYIKKYNTFLSNFHYNHTAGGDACFGSSNSMYGKRHSFATRRKMSIAKNTTGYLFVRKEDNTRFLNGYEYVYTYRDSKNKRRTLRHWNLNGLKERVQEKGLPWEEL